MMNTDNTGKKLVTEKPVVFVGFDDIVEFNQKSTEWWWFGLDLKKSLFSCHNWNSLKKKHPKLTKLCTLYASKLCSFILCAL